MKQFDPRQPLQPGITLVEASAGTGKTYSITSLVLRLLLEVPDLQLSQILMVTFTRAATAELRGRVRDRIRDASACLERVRAGVPIGEAAGGDPVLTKIAEDAREPGRPGELDRRILALSRAYAGFDEAAISTIHGFCQQTLLQSAFESRIALDAEPVSDIDDIVQEIVDDFWAGELTDAPLAWIELLTAQKIRRDELRALAYAVSSDPDATVVPGLLEADGARGRPGSPQRWAVALTALAEAWERTGARATAALLQLHKDGAFEKKAKDYNSRQPKTRARRLDAWASARDQDDPFGVHGLEGLDDLVYFSAAAVSGALNDPTDLTGVDPEVLALLELADAATIVPAEQFLRRFVDYARDELPRRKAERAVLSFDDLLRTLADRLGEPGARESLRASVRQRFRVALIDEFQDTDPVQWTIFREVFSEPVAGDPAYLFLIGDPKQAIYSFRGADLNTYVGARDHALAGRYTMTTNWRSDGRYLAALNQLLGRPGIFGQREVEYVQVQAAPHHEADGLVPGPGSHALGAAATLRLVYFDRQLTGTGGQGVVSKGWAGQWLPRHLAEEVVEQLQAGEHLVLERDDAGEPSRTRPVRPGDVAVLVRANWQAAAMQSALLEAGVPAVIEGGASVFEAPEALDVQRLLEGLLRPTSDRTIRAALVGCLFRLTGTELAALTDQDWDRWLGQFLAWAELWRDRGFMAALRRILQDSGVVPGVLARPGGERVLTNLLQLAELLHAAEQESKLGPVGLLAWLRHRRALGRAERDEEQLRLESDADAVTVSTMHAAKGLEYPLVWCPWLWDGTGLRGTRLLRVHDPDCDPPQVLDLHLAAHRAPKREHVGMAERESRAESLRLLYVALTRARHRCTVYWGPFGSADTSPLAALLHGGHGEDPDPLSAGEARVAEADDEALFDDLQAHAAASDGTIDALRAAPLEQLRWAPPSPGDASQIQARRFERPQLDSWWRRGSFSSLTRGASHGTPAGDEVNRDATPGAEGIDHDDATTLVGTLDSGEEPTESQLAFPVPLAHFPRGAEAGTFLHAIFEYVDFGGGADPSAPDLGQQLDRLMPRFGIDEAHRPMLLEGLRAALRTPFGGPLIDQRLADVGRGDRLDELAFDLPVAADGPPDRPGASMLTSRTLAQVFVEHRPELDSAVPGYADRIAELGFGPPLRGFLTGQLDLVFRAPVLGRSEPQWFVVDYKSNWLGERLMDANGARVERCTSRHYAPGRMAQAMAEHHYVLQYHLYLLALHRYLRWRLGPVYDYDTHIGGAYYLFLRGMIGDSTPSVPAEHGRQRHGVYFHRPSKSMIQSLDRCFAMGSLGGAA